jgi:hypothetical protein
MKWKRPSPVYVTAPCKLGLGTLLPSSRLAVLET